MEASAGVLTRLSRGLRKAYHSLPEPPSTNYNLGTLDVNPYSLVPRGGTVLDVGAGNLQGAYAAFPSTGASNGLRMLMLDLDPGGPVDVCADAHAIPLRDASVDAVICVSVLEYVWSPQMVIAECHRVLKPGGVLYLSAPFIFPNHAPPDDNFRFSMTGLKALARGFEPIRIGYNRGPASTFCHIWVHFLAITCSFGSRALYGIVLDGAKWSFFWLKYLDRWIGRFEPARVLHGSAFFLGRKAGAGAMAAHSR